MRKHIMELLAVVFSVTAQFTSFCLNSVTWANFLYLGFSGPTPFIFSWCGLFYQNEQLILPKFVYITVVCIFFNYVMVAVASFLWLALLCIISSSLYDTNKYLIQTNEKKRNKQDQQLVFVPVTKAMKPLGKASTMLL